MVAVLVGGPCGSRYTDAVFALGTPLSKLQPYGPCSVWEPAVASAAELRVLFGRCADASFHSNCLPWSRLASLRSGWTSAAAPFRTRALSSINATPLVLAVSHPPCWSLPMSCDTRGTHHCFTPRAERGKYFVLTAAEQKIPGPAYSNPVGVSMHRGGCRA